MKYRLAIFDFDGTLADSFPFFMGVMNLLADTHGFRRVEEHEVETLRGYEARRIMGHVGMPMWKMPLVARDFRKRMAAEIGCIPLFPGVDRMLERLNDAGVAVAIVTSNSFENVRSVLGPRGAGLVRYYGCGASVFGKRPKLRKVLRDSGVPAGEAICVGDEIRDLHAARAEGIAFGAVSWGYTSLESLRAHSPEEVFASIDEVTETLVRGEARGPSARFA